jgi:hypothetical protein
LPRQLVRRWNRREVQPTSEPLRGQYTASRPILVIASGLEARYIGLEADGPSGAMLTFVNGRRAVAGKAAVTLSGAALMAELRAQRAIDFYLTGQRLGHLRRYAAAGLDLFPRGTYPVPPDSYGSLRCFIVPRSEKAGNPNS